jgi:hypothetical protein
MINFEPEIEKIKSELKRLIDELLDYNFKPLNIHDMMSIVENMLDHGSEESFSSVLRIAKPFGIDFASCETPSLIIRTIIDKNPRKIISTLFTFS